MTDWTHPRIANPACRLDAPASDIAAAARAAFDRRRDTYPQLVQAGQITADEARADLEGWRAVAKDWHWIATGEGERATRLTLDSRIAALDTAVTRWFDRYDQHGGGSEQEIEQLFLMAAMRIWAGRERSSSSTQHRQFFASVAHEFRRNATTAPRKDAA